MVLIDNQLNENLQSFFNKILRIYSTLKILGSASEKFVNENFLYISSAYYSN